MEDLSINSSIDGLFLSFKREIAALNPLLISSNDTKISEFAPGFDKILSVILEKRPRVPSEPVKSCVRLYPETFLTVFEPVHIISPSPVITSSAAT